MSLQGFECVIVSHKTALRGQLIIIPSLLALQESIGVPLFISQRKTNVATAGHRPLNDFVKQSTYVISVCGGGDGGGRGGGGGGGGC